MPKTGILTIIVLLLLSGCTYWPRAEEWQEATIKAASDPATWAPVAGAAAITLGDYDKKISKWAREATPLCGSQEEAQEASDRFHDYAQLGMAAAILAPHENDTEYWLPTAQRAGVAVAGMITTDNITGWMKEGSERERPNKRNNRSFPSGHTTMAFFSTGTANRHIDALPISRTWRYSAKGVETTLAMATAWSRVEAGMHYPSDVLAGAAVGNFIAIFLHETFLEGNEVVRIATDAYGTPLFLLEKRF